MKPKTALSVLLLSFVGASLAYLVRDVIRSTAPSPDEAATRSADAPKAPSGPPLETSPPPAGHKVIAYYFHGNQRCPTCLAIERQAREALDEAFPEAFRSGVLEWRAVNIDESANSHFVREYELTSSTVVLAEIRGGRQESWRRLDRVWELVRDELKFKAYVEAEAAVILEPDS
jgi:hypothetical protein